MPSLPTVHHTPMSRTPQPRSSAVLVSIFTLQYVSCCSCRVQHVDVQHNHLEIIFKTLPLNNEFLQLELGIFAGVGAAGSPSHHLSISTWLVSPPEYQPRHSTHSGDQAAGRHTNHLFAHCHLYHQPVVQKYFRVDSKIFECRDGVRGVDMNMAPVSGVGG